MLPKISLMFILAALIALATGIPVVSPPEGDLTPFITGGLTGGPFDFPFGVGPAIRVSLPDTHCYIKSSPFHIQHNLCTYMALKAMCLLPCHSFINFLLKQHTPAHSLAAHYSMHILRLHITPFKLRTL